MKPRGEGRGGKTHKKNEKNPKDLPAHHGEEGTSKEQGTSEREEAKEKGGGEERIGLSEGSKKDKERR